MFILFPVLVLVIIFYPNFLQAQWNTNTSVNIQISGLSDDDMESAPTTDNKTWVAFYSQNGGSYDMRAQLIDANGYKLLGPNGVLVSNQPTGSAIFVFNVCVDASNNLIIGCQDMRSGSMQAVLYKISQAGVHLWSSNGLILGLGLAPYPAVLSNGEVVVAWNEETGNTLKLQKITTSGTLAWATPISIMVGSSTTTRGQITPNLGGKFTMVYQKSGTGISTTLYAQMFDNSGTALYAPLQICNQTTSGARYYSIISEGDTTYFGYYSSIGLRFNSFLQRINPSGVIPWGINGSNFNTNVGSSDYYQMETAIAITPGNNYVWAVCTFSNTNQSQYGVYIQKFLKTIGTRQFTDAAKVVYPISANSDRQVGKLVLVESTPMFMSYDVNEKIYATRLDANGNFSWPGNRVEISSTTAPPGTPKMRYGFTPDGPNRCAGVWTENRGSGYLGYAQGISVGGLIGLLVTTQGGVPSTITVSGGTLQMVATVFPTTANQNVSWSIVPGTGAATISSSGLVSAVLDGTVYAKATSVQDNTIKDSLMITISGQVPMAPSVTTLDATNITGASATLNGSVTAFSSSANISFQWGTSASYGYTATATPSTASGNSPTAVIANLTSLAEGTTYHFRCVAVNTVGTSYGSDKQFTTCMVPGTPGNITGPATVCQNQENVVYSIATVVNATSYIWTLPGGAFITAGEGTNNITVHFSSTAVSGNISVAGTNSCITGASSTLSVTVNPAPTPVISGPNSACTGSGNYNYSTSTGMSNYVWAISPGGEIISGEGTPSIVVHWNTTGYQNVQVNYNNANGCHAQNPTIYDVVVEDVPSAAGDIIGPSSVCAGSQGIVYTVNPIAGASNYQWILPPGAVIVSGAGTNSIVLNYAFNAVSGNLSVFGENNCGSGTSSGISITVSPAPPKPMVTVNGYVLTSSAAQGNQWYRDGFLIPGANEQSYAVTMTGWYWTVVTTAGCPSDSSNNIHILFVGIDDQTGKSLHIYPLPNEGKFNIRIDNDTERDYRLQVFNPLGIKIYEKEGRSINHNNILVVDLGTVPTGLYTIILNYGDEKLTQKVLIHPKTY